MSHGYDVYKYVKYFDQERKTKDHIEQIIEDVLKNSTESLKKDLEKNKTTDKNNKEKNMKNETKKNVLFLAPGYEYAKTVVSNLAKTLDKKQIPYNATPYPNFGIHTNEVDVDIVYCDPLKWTEYLFHKRDAIFGKKELLAQANHKFFHMGFHTPSVSLSKYIIENSTADYTEAPPTPDFYLPEIKNAYFNNPCTVVIWMDGTKTMVRCQEGDTYSKETGLALCIAKKAFGNMPNFNNIFKKWIPEETDDTDKNKEGLL